MSLIRRLFFRLAFIYPRIYAFFSFYLEKRRKREYEGNVKLFFSEDKDPKGFRRITRSMFELKGMRKMQRYLIPHIDHRFIRQSVEMEGLDILDRALSGERGIVLLSAHFGNLGIGLSILRKLGYGVYFLKGGNPEKQRSRNALYVNPPEYSIYIPTPPVSHSTKEKILETLRSGKTICYTVDSAWGRKKAEVSCFGRTLNISTGMIYYARQANAIVLPFIQLYRRGSIKLIIKEPIDGQWKEGERDYTRVIEEFAKILEFYILGYPEEYYGDIRYLVS
jgi:Kdo2-lipid IVA lauroyltransferase/acyltransferase